MAKCSKANSILNNKKKRSEEKKSNYNISNRISISAMLSTKPII